MRIVKIIKLITTKEIIITCNIQVTLELKYLTEYFDIVRKPQEAKMEIGTIWAPSLKRNLPTCNRFAKGNSKNAEIAQ